MAYTKQVTLTWSQSPLDFPSGEDFVRENKEFLDAMKINDQVEKNSTIMNKSRIRNFRDQEAAQAWIDFHESQVIKHGLTAIIFSRTISDVTE